MLRSLFAGISGLRANQTALDVVGNNIANANTAGFKGSNVVFQDTLSQLLTGAGAPVEAADPNPARGGTNPVQVGLGVAVAGTTTNFGQGSAQVTGRASDLMVQGDGFFVVQRGEDLLYTRAGAFNFDANGNLVSLDGDLVMGTLAPVTGTTVGPMPAFPAATDDLEAIQIDFKALGVQSFSIGGDGKIVGVIDGEKVELGQIALATFVNPEGLERAGDTSFRASTNSGEITLFEPGAPGAGKLMGGALEMSNVDLAQEFTNLIIAQRGFQATSRVITTSDAVLEELVNIKR